jgi:hypothetical protein
MDFAICLDQFSTNFDVNNLSSNGFSIYTNLDNYTTPIAQNIPYQDLFAPPIGNCPLVVTLPQGATQLVVIDACTTLPTNIASIFTNGSSTANNLITQCCYAIISVPTQSVPFCTTCDLNFDVFSSSYVGQIVAGNLTSTCGTITDYKIGWYKDGDYSSPVFTSGYGNSFLPYQNLHPLTGNQAVPSLAGDWEGIIHDIAINGTTYSSVSGSAGGTPIPFESCFDTIVVDPLTCLNGPYSASAKYSHQKTFNSQAIGTTSSPVSFTYVLDSTTKYFAYLFDTFGVWDEIEIRWKSGNPAATPNPSLYSQPIYLEKLKKGNFVSPNGWETNSLPNLGIAPGINWGNYLSMVNDTWPKVSSDPGYNQLSYGFQRVLTLDTLPTSSNPATPDFLEITITPNPANNNTQWKAAFQCLDTFDCTDCYWSDWPNSLPKIYEIELNKIHGCDKQKLQIRTTGCLDNSDLRGSGNPLNSFQGNLVMGQLGTSQPLNTNWAPPNQYVYIPLSTITSCALSEGQANSFCGPSSTGTITLNKTLGQIQLVFNLYSDFLYYKNKITDSLDPYTPSSGFTGTIPISCDPYQALPYHKYFKIKFPIQGANVNCGDNSTYVEYPYHVNDAFDITYINDNNPNATSWGIIIPQSPMVNCTPLLGCNNCNDINTTFVNNYNSLISNPVVFSYTTNVGAKTLNPITFSHIAQGSQGGISGSYCLNTNENSGMIPMYAVHTMPFISSSNSPTGWVNLTSLFTKLPCNFTPYEHMYNGFLSTGVWGRAYSTAYRIRFPHLTSSGFDYSLSTNDFEIYTITNLSTTGSRDYSGYPVECPPTPGSSSLIYSYIAGVPTVYSASYFAGGVAPTLIIDP